MYVCVTANFANFTKFMRVINSLITFPCVLNNENEQKQGMNLWNVIKKMMQFAITQPY